MCEQTDASDRVLPGTDPSVPITELWDEYLESGGEALPLLKVLIDEAWEQLTEEDTIELRRFLSY